MNKAQAITALISVLEEQCGEDDTFVADFRVAARTDVGRDGLQAYVGPVDYQDLRASAFQAAWKAGLDQSALDQVEDAVTAVMCASVLERADLRVA